MAEYCNDVNTVSTAAKHIKKTRKFPALLFMWKASEVNQQPRIAHMLLAKLEKIGDQIQMTLYDPLEERYSPNNPTLAVEMAKSLGIKLPIIRKYGPSHVMFDLTDPVNTSINNDELQQIIEKMQLQV